MSAPCLRQMGIGLDLIGQRADGSEFPVDISLRPVLIGTAIGHAIASGEAIYQHQVVIRRPDGTSLSILVNAIPLDALHTLYRLPSALARMLSASERVVLAVYQGVAALKEAEYFKDEFIGIAVHELRQPLSALKAAVGTLVFQTARGHGPPLADWQIEIP